MSRSAEQALDGVELRARRRALGLTQAQLGTALGVSGNSVARWERAEVQMNSPALVLLALEGLEARRPGADPSSPPIALPKARTSFIGREREVRDLSHLIRGSRLV